MKTFTLDCPHASAFQASQMTLCAPEDTFRLAVHVADNPAHKLYNPNGPTAIRPEGLFYMIEFIAPDELENYYGEGGLLGCY